jgi:hypothetical protein
MISLVEGLFVSEGLFLLLPEQFVEDEDEEEEEEDDDDEDEDDEDDDNIND